MSNSYLSVRRRRFDAALWELREATADLLSEEGHLEHTEVLEVMEDAYQSAIFDYVEEHDLNPLDYINDGRITIYERPPTMALVILCVTVLAVVWLPIILLWKWLA